VTDKLAESSSPGACTSTRSSRNTLAFPSTADDPLSRFKYSFAGVAKTGRSPASFTVRKGSQPEDSSRRRARGPARPAHCRGGLVLPGSRLKLLRFPPRAWRARSICLAYMTRVRGSRCSDAEDGLPPPKMVRAPPIPRFSNVVRGVSGPVPGRRFFRRWRPCPCNIDGHSPSTSTTGGWSDRPYHGVRDPGRDTGAMIFSSAATKRSRGATGPFTDYRSSEHRRKCPTTKPVATYLAEFGLPIAQGHESPFAEQNVLAAPGPGCHT